MCRTGIICGPERNGGITARITKFKDAGTARRQGGRSSDSTGGKRAGQHDIPLNAEEMVQKGRKLDVTDEARGQTVDRKGGLHY